MAQWTRPAHGIWSPVGDTQAELPPGLYDVAISQGQLLYVQLPSRRDELFRFPSTKTDEVVDEIEKFWEREEVFKTYGLPFKRGILLWGPPGCGKTCTTELVSRDVIGRGGLVVNFSAGTFMAGYRGIREVQPEVPIVVLMEDLDDILKEARGNDTRVINILDGAEQLHKVVFLATTNYPERLEARVLNRPSRFDRRLEIGYPDAIGRKMYLESLFQGNDPGIDVDAYVRDTVSMSLAHVKELFVGAVILGRPYADVLEDLREMMTDRPSSVYDDQTKENGQPRGLFGQYV